MRALPYPHHPPKVLQVLLLQAFLPDPDPHPYPQVQQGPSLPEANNELILKSAIRIQTMQRKIARNNSFIEITYKQVFFCLCVFFIFSEDVF